MTQFLLPVLALIIWSLLIAVLLYARRIPAMQAARIHPDKAKSPDGAWKRDLPLPAQYAAHNFSHLMESPTIFYALMFVIYLLGSASTLLMGLAWGYVVLRVIHSIIQVSGGAVMKRFIVFSLSSILLMVMAGITVVSIL